MDGISSILTSTMPRLVWSSRETMLMAVSEIAEEIEKEKEDIEDRYLNSFGRAKADFVPIISSVPPNLANEKNLEEFREKYMKFSRAVVQITYSQEGVDTGEDWTEMVEEEEGEEEEGEEEIEGNLEDLSEEFKKGMMGV